MLTELTIRIANISDYATLAAGILVLFRTSGRREHYLLCTWLLLSGILKTGCIYLADRYINNMPFYHLNGLVELIFICLIYQRRSVHLYWNLFAGGIVLTYLLNSLFIQSVYEVNSLALAINQLFVLLLGSRFLAELYQKHEVTDIGRYPFFYINAGFMLYAAGAFFVYLLSSKIFEHDPSDFFHNAWIMESVFNLFRLLLVCTGVMLSRRE